MKVELPKADAPTMEQEKLLKVSITKDNQVYIADMKVELSELSTVSSPCGTVRWPLS